MSFGFMRHNRFVAVQLALALVLGTMAAIAASPAGATSPGGNGYIAFHAIGPDLFRNLYVMPADGSSGPVAIESVQSPLADPVFSPDGTRMAFSRDVGGNARIWVADFDASVPALAPLGTWIEVTDGTTDGSPTWSPDGTQIAFTRWVAVTGTATTEDLTGMTLADTGASFRSDLIGQLLTNTDSGASGTIVSVTDSTTLVLDGLTGGTDSELNDGDPYVIEDGRRQILVTPATADLTTENLSMSGASPEWDDANPVWSPDGTRIAFDTNETANNRDIKTMSAVDGSDRKNLTDATTQFNRPATRPSWSPDGQRIAFQSSELGGATGVNIWAVDSVDGSNPVNITGAATASTDDTQAVWSPDGTQIAFVRDGGTTWKIASDGSGDGFAEVSSAAPATHSDPDWQPALVGVDDDYTVDEGGTLVVPADGVLENDGIIGALAAPTAVKTSDPTNGTLTLAADGSFIYTHDGSETTSDSFTYSPKQGTVTGSTATVTISVTPVNDPPKAVNDGPFAVAVAGGSFVLPAPGVLGNDSDPEGDPLTAVKVSDPSHGSVTLNANGSFTYVHDGSATTTDSFTYQAMDDSDALSNVATVSLTIGVPPVVPPVVPSVVHSTGLVDPSQGLWRLYDDVGGLETSFFFGNPGDYPIFGDWDGDGVETPGMYRQSDGFVYLRNSNTQGAGEIRFFFGNPGDVPIAGDFNGDGFDTVSIYRPSIQTFFIINELGANEGGLGAAEFSYVFGDPGDKPFVGDFDGDGVETVGLHRESTGLVYFRNSHTQGNADAQFIFGDPGDRLIAGDWNGDGKYSPALFRPSNTTMFFRYTNTQGVADNQFVPVPAGSTWLPIAGQTG